jgi:hypothetical protein
MTVVRRALIVAVLGSVLAMTPHYAAAQQPTEQQGEFVPAGDLPQREQVPAAPLLIGAYAFVMLALFGYVFSVSRRLGAIKADLGRLEADIKRGSRA